MEAIQWIEITQNEYQEYHLIHSELSVLTKNIDKNCEFNPTPIMETIWGKYKTPYLKFVMKKEYNSSTWKNFFYKNISVIK